MARRVAVTIDRLTLAHGDRVALSDVSLNIEAGLLVAVIGPNGSGKSTMMNAIAGLHQPAAGSVTVFGTNPQSASISYVFQTTEVPEYVPLTVTEVVTMGLYRRTGLLGRIGSHGRSAVNSSIERVGLDEVRSRQLHELSGGQRQRVLVAQGIAGEADLLLLDEPMTGLDVIARQRILDIMREETRCGRTVLFSTHDMDEAKTADLVILLSGRLVSVGEPSLALSEDHLRDAYMAGLLSDDAHRLAVLDDPHHHGSHH